MDYKTLLVAIAFVLSCCLNVYLFYRLKQKKKDKEFSSDARQLLHDLTRGAGLVRVIPIDPEGIFYRSPRGR